MRWARYRNTTRRTRPPARTDMHLQRVEGPWKSRLRLRGTGAAARCTFLPGSALTTAREVPR